MSEKQANKLTAQERNQAHLEQHTKRIQRLQRAFGNVTSSEDGLVVFKHIMAIAGFKGVSIVGNPTTGDLHDRGTLYNEARRNLYLELRRLVPPKNLNKIEMETEHDDSEETEI